MKDTVGLEATYPKSEDGDFTAYLWKSHISDKKEDRSTLITLKQIM